ncbi:MAG: hypothetical protein HKO56_00605, partial [Bacteroidia bacterium]|nr:hypothetical protein [Bacteroidia bacterium]
DRLGWVGPNKKYSLSALDLFGKEVRTDLDGNNVEHEGIYVLRDFVSTGDALRVKLPGIRDNEYPQWIWIENHQTKAFNGSEFDTFQFAEAKCVDDPVPGIYAYMQVDKDIKEGSKLYSGYGDYIRPIPATGMYDFVFSEEKIPNRCINSKPMQSFARVPSLQNALTGNHMLEFPVGDLNGNGSISSKEGRIMAIEKIGKDEYVYRLPYLGHSDMAFTMDGNNEIGIGTNPSANNMYTLVSAEPGTRGGVLGKDGFGKPNNRIIFLNGVSIKILENLSGGKIKVEVKFNQTEISRNTRWCADSIVLPNIANAEYDLQIKNKSVLTLDQGLTATRIINPVEFDKEKIFASPTQLFAQQNTKILINEKSKVQVINGSKLAMLDNSVLVLDEESKLEIDKTSFLVLSNQSKIIVKGKSELIIRNKTLFELLKELNVVEVESGKFRYCR